MMRLYMEDRDMDTVFHVWNQSTEEEIYLLDDWGKATKARAIAWTRSLLTTGVGDSEVCEWDRDNLRWSGRAVLASITLDDDVLDAAADRTVAPGAAAGTA